MTGAGKYAPAVVTDDYRVLLDRDDIDIIDVATRDSEHFAINLAVVEAGKHVLSEKPVQPGCQVPVGHAHPGRPRRPLHLQRL